MGDALYDERRRLERESDLLQAQNYNARLKRAAATDGLADLAIKSLRAFLEGKAAIIVTPGNTEDSQMAFFQITEP